MKNIRTKDGRIVDTETKYLNFVSKEEYLKQVKENKEGLIVSYVENNVWYCYCEGDGCVEWKYDILKQSDTIDELCDEFVYTDERFHNTGHILPREDLNKKQELIFHIEKNHVAIYGAIWTNKGLIYVAKMNEKGELELI